MKARAGRYIKIIAGAITASALAVFVYVLVHATLYAPESESPLPASSWQSSVRPDSGFYQGNGSGPPATLASRRPSRLIIPALDIDANIQEVGITYGGNIGVPNNFTDVAWYKYGPVPGAPGTAIINGHLDNGLALPGIFKHLDSIGSGDEIDIADESGKLAKFTVETTDSYFYKKMPMTDIFTTAGKPRLALITCTGTWVSSDRTYDHRLVVIAVQAN